MSMMQKLRFLSMLAIGPLSVGQLCFGQSHETVLTIELQRPPNNMEPVNEPRRIRVDDRSSARILLLNVSPLDICSLGNRTPTPTPETFAMEALVTNLNAIPAVFGVGGGEPTRLMADVTRPKEEDKVPDKVWGLFWDAAGRIAGSANDTLQVQLGLQKQLDGTSRNLVAYASANYRGTGWTAFQPEALVDVRRLYTDPLKSIALAAQNQAVLDEMTTWATYLHKKFDVSDPSSKEPTDENVAKLQKVDLALGAAKAALSILGDNNTALKAAQTALRTAHMALPKVYDDFQRRHLDQKTIKTTDAGVLSQEFLLGRDRKVTITGVLSCVSSADGKPTTNQINYSILYQDVPRLTFSAGLLTTFLEKKIIGTENISAPNGGYNTVFAVTDRAQAQVFPMAYLNYRVFGYRSKLLGRTHEDEWVFTTNLGGGLGIDRKSTRLNSSH